MSICTHCKTEMHSLLPLGNIANIMNFVLHSSIVSNAMDNLICWFYERGDVITDCLLAIKTPSLFSRSNSNLIELSHLQVSQGVMVRLKQIGVSISDPNCPLQIASFKPLALLKIGNWQTFQQVSHLPCSHYNSYAAKRLRYLVQIFYPCSLRFLH